MIEKFAPTYYVLLVTINVTLSLVMILAACLWCKKKVPKNELLGLEGMVKLKNPDDMIVVTTLGNSESQAELNLSTVSNADSEKRASTAAHRSLPDIPVVETNGDNGSELYETVADKRLIDTQNNRDKSPTPSLKKQTSVSQHSSISQADDVSSPYSRVKNSPHDYAKVRSTEHPYAQLNAPSSSNAALTSTSSASTGGSNSSQMKNNDSLNRSSHHSDSSQNINDSAPHQAEIPAASAIAGMISASQDLPYMTPPIANQHFSGDSQDSSSYTSISVREPLANILAQQPSKTTQRSVAHSRDVNDSHYATVSDDSDETYAAIEDPNLRSNHNVAADIYTSGSETYAQIQPMQANSIVVSVEINNSSASMAMAATGTAHNPLPSEQSSNNNNTSSMVAHHVLNSHNRPTSSASDHTTPIPPPVDSLRAQMHSRQASSSSNISSSVGNLGSPKPEKRQANSPLPPTPKSNLTSGRNSVVSVIECGGVGVPDSSSSGSNIAPIASAEGSPQKKNKSLSPSKDIEGMYAKVMKKNKFSRNSPSSQNNSPIMSRKFNDHTSSLGVSPLDSAAAELIEAHRINVSTTVVGNCIIDGKGRMRSNSYSAQDHGYETIPADSMRNAVGMENRKSDCYTNILQKERQQEGDPLNYTNAKPPNVSELQQQQKHHLYRNEEKHYETIASPSMKNNSDPGYETLLKPKNQSDPDSKKKSSDYDPNYEVLATPKYTTTSANHSNSNSAGLSDDGYAKVIEKKSLILDDVDGYSKVKGEECEDITIGYSTIGEVKNSISASAIANADTNHNYASILETKGEMNKSQQRDTDSDHYARIAEERIPVAPDLPLSSVSTPAKLGGGSGDDDLRTPRLPELPITSPSSLNSSSILNNSSTMSSFTNATTTSTTSTMSSRQTPSSSSQYESLTGSDTDPNYESVCYLNTSQENPYERLQTDFSDTQLSTPLTPDERSLTNTASGGEQSSFTTPLLKRTSANGPKVNATDVSATDVVDDYFQV